ncbi:MAG: hypothetical protein HY276_12975, partial [Ignavibacteriales bacterium]|nr:hypothetical protein [Ignavibacteriales bacterium]
MTESLLAQSPVKKTYAYSRHTTPGIPEDTIREAPRKPLLTSHFIYVVVKKDAALSVRNVWLQGKYYAASLRKVNSPVVIDRDAAVPTGKKDTLVGKTSDDLYQVELAEESNWTPKNDAEKKLVQSNEVVVFLEAGKVSCYGSAKKIKNLRPVV